jgi:hypothetical protein
VTEALDADAIAVCRERDGLRTGVLLDDGRHLLVMNIAWGYDEGDPWAHVITNISPRSQGAMFR